MCGRFAMDDEVNAQIEAWVEQGNNLLDWRPAAGDRLAVTLPIFSVAPSMRIPLLLADTGHRSQRGVGVARWGFHPAWARATGPRPINARLESVATNGMFRSAFASHRAVVPMSGYFEWTAAPTGGKDPWYIHGDGVLFAPAVWTTRPTDAGQERTFVLITCAATDASGRIHDRMPAFLPAPALDAWLSEPAASAQHLLHTTAEQVAATLSAYPVSRRINSVRQLDPHDPTLLDEENR